MRYGTFLYGGGATGATYGASPVVTTLLWSFIVDWDSDGYYSGENEVTYMVDFSLSRGRDHFIETGGGGFERYAAGKATIILDNTDGRFNPFNTSSPLYPDVTPGKSCRILVQEGSGGTNHSLMRGRISDIQPYSQGNRKMVKIDVVDGQQFLRDRTIKIGLFQGSYPVSVTAVRTTGWWVDLILERADWPEDEWPRTYDELTDYGGHAVPGSTEDFYTQLNYAWFWNRDALDAIRELENVELGTFLHDRDGNARFLSQHFTLDQITALDEDQLLTDITIPQPWETLRNKIEITVNPIEIHEVDGIIGAGTGTALLWSVGGLGANAIPIAAEGSFTVDATFRWQNFSSIVPINMFIDFTVNDRDDGTGTDLTPQCTVTYSEFGNGATISLSNNSISDGGYILFLGLYGDAIYAEFESTVSAEDEDSHALYGTRVFKLSSPWMQEAAYAQAGADFLLENLKDPSQYPTTRIENRADIQFALDLYVDVVHLTSDELSIDSLYRIGKIDHAWLQPTGQAVLTTLKLEPYFAVGASSEINNLLSPFASAVEVDGTTPPAAGRMLWTLDDTWEYGTGEGNPTGSLRHYLINPAGFLDKSAITSPVGHTVEAGERFDFDYIWIPGVGGSGTIGGTNLIRVEVYIGASLRVNQTYSPGPYNVWQTASFDLSEWAGETLTSIEFIRAAGAGVGFDDQRILFDNVFIGR